MSLTLGITEIGLAVKEFLVKKMNLQPNQIGPVKITRGKGEGEEAVRAECSIDNTEPAAPEKPGNGQE